MAFLKVLSKIGLVQLDEKTPVSSDADIEKLLSEDVEELLGKKMKSMSDASVAPGTDQASSLNTSFEDIYKKAGVGTPPFSAEKLLRVMDGLKGMDPLTRKAAVLAMDAADDDWSIDGVVADAKAKIGAIENAKSAIRAEVSREDSITKSGLKKQDDYLVEATKTIEQQILELRAQLEQECQSVKDGKAGIQSKYDLLLASAIKEEDKLQKEVIRLKEITTAFTEVKNG